MSTIWHCNKERERNTHLRVKEASWNIASLLSYLKSGGIAPHPPPLQRLILAVRFGVLATQFGVSPSVGVANSRRHRKGGGWLGLPSRGLSPKQKELVFWLFLLSYMTSGPFYLMVFSPINTALLLILFWPSGDGYSLLCSSKSSFRGTSVGICKILTELKQKALIFVKFSFKLKDVPHSDGGFHRAQRWMEKKENIKQRRTKDKRF